MSQNRNVFSKVKKKGLWCCLNWTGASKETSFHFQFPWLQPVGYKSPAGLWTQTELHLLLLLADSRSWGSPASILLWVNSHNTNTLRQRYRLELYCPTQEMSGPTRSWKIQGKILPKLSSANVALPATLSVTSGFQIVREYIPTVLNHQVGYHFLRQS